MPWGAHLELDVLHLWRLFRVEAGVLKAQERTRVSGLDLFQGHGLAPVVDCMQAV